jgi:hypothetical protein
MIKSLREKISNDLQESRITLKVIILFLPIAFFTYFFHEFGHWMFGELSGNDMTLGLNTSAPKSGYFIHQSHALWSAVGGPAFTIIQAFVFLLITRATNSIYAYSCTFFAAFSRFFSIVFGGITVQDEARIASMTNANMYIVAAIVLAILFLILWNGSRIMKLNTKAAGYFTVVGTCAILVVIGVNKFMMTE